MSLAVDKCITLHYRKTYFYICALDCDFRDHGHLIPVSGPFNNVDFSDALSHLHYIFNQVNLKCFYTSHLLSGD